SLEGGPVRDALTPVGEVHLARGRLVAAALGPQGREVEPWPRRGSVTGLDASLAVHDGAVDSGRQDTVAGPRDAVRFQFDLEVERVVPGRHRPQPHDIAEG